MAAPDERHALWTSPPRPYLQLLWQKFCSLSLRERAQGPGSIQIANVRPPEQGGGMVPGICGTCVACIGLEGVLQWLSNLPGGSVEYHNHGCSSAMCGVKMTGAMCGVKMTGDTIG